MPFSRADTSIVTSCDDSGAGTLRDILTASVDGDIIQFNFTDPSCSNTILITSASIAVDKAVTIDGAGITTINGSGLPSSTACFEVTGSSLSLGQHAILKGLTVTSCTGTGIYVNDSPSNIIGGDTSAEKNIIISNSSHGINISGSSATSNIVIGNYIGLAANGTSDAGNALSNVRIDNSAPSNTIGSILSAERNYIYGANNGAEVSIGSAGSGNTVIGNYIGINASGNALGKIIGSGEYGVAIVNTSGTIIGGEVAGATNVISGNSGAGIFINGSPSTVIKGNYIGTDPTGVNNTDTANAEGGIRIWSTAAANSNLQIGGTASAARNIIAGNGNYGIEFAAGSFASTTTGITILGNYIGLNATGNTVLANGSDGVRLKNAGTVTIGGTTSGSRNYISGNGGGGIMVVNEVDNTATTLAVYGNTIGLKVDGSAAGNGGAGIEIGGTLTGILIGSDTSGAGNIISSNTSAGIDNTASTASGTIIKGNIIGLGSDGASLMGNGGAGIYMMSSNNTIGSTNSNGRNTISANAADGVRIDGTDITGNTILGNYIGLSSDGLSDFGNIVNGVYVSNGADSTIIGGSAVGAYNVISGNTANGIRVTGAGTTSTSILMNYIGLNKNGDTAVANGANGIKIDGGSSGTTVGSVSGSGTNVISGNTSNGILIDGSNSNTIVANRIGLDTSSAIDFDVPSNNTDLGNTLDGISLISGSSSNVIGSATSTTLANVFGFNVYGVSVDGASASLNTIRFNRFLISDTASITLTNASNGSIAAPTMTIYTSSTLRASVGAADGSLVDFYYESGRTYINSATVSGGFATIVGSFTTGSSVSAQVKDGSSNSSAFSGLQTITADITPPAARTDLTIDSSGDSFVQLIWTLNTEVDKDDYTVYRSTSTPVTQISGNIIASGLTSSTYTDTEVTNGTRYYYAVSAFDTVGNESGLSNEVNARPLDAVAPSAPVISSVVVGDTQLTINWNANGESDMNHYDLYRSTSIGFTLDTVGFSNRIASSLSTSTLTYNDTGLTNATAYYYKLIAYDNSDNASSSSNEGSGTPVDSTAPSAPVISGVVVGDTQLTVNWDANGESDMNYYDLYRSTSTGFTPDTVGFSNRIVSGLSTSTLTYNDTGLTNAIVYYYKLIAYDNTGNASSASNEGSGTPVDSTAPAAPANFIANAENGAVTLDWAENVESDFDHYQIYRSEVSPIEGIPNNLLVSTSVSNYIDNTAQEGVRYYYFVIAYDINNNFSAPSIEENEMVITIPAPPSNLTLVAGDSEIILNWDDNVELDFNHYAVYRSEVSSFIADDNVNLLIGGLTSSAYIDTSVSNATTYYYQVQANDNTGNASNSSVEVSATPQATVVIETASSGGGSGGQSTSTYFDSSSTTESASEANNTELVDITEEPEEVIEEVKPDLYIKSVFNFSSYFKVELCSDNEDVTGAYFQLQYGNIVNKLRYAGTIQKNTCKILGSWGLSYFGISQDGDYLITATADPDNLIDEGEGFEFNSRDFTVHVNFYDESENNADEEEMSNTAAEQLDITNSNLDDQNNTDTNNTVNNQDSDVEVVEASLVDDSISDDEDVSDEHEVAPEEEKVEVQGIPKESSEESVVDAGGSSGEDGSSGSGGGSSSSGGQNIIITKRATQNTIEEVQGCNYEYYGGEEIYNEILDVYDLTDEEALYVDIDEDDLNAIEECANNTNPLIPDSDKDSLTDGEEVKAYLTNPLLRDTDSDGFSDGIEIKYNTDPLDPNDFPDVCDITENYNTDEDKDGLPNGVECEIGTDPVNGDSDSDNLSDAEEFIDYNSNPLEKNEDVKLQCVFPSYDAVLATSTPFFQCVAPEGEKVVLNLKRDINGDTYVLDTIVSGGRSKFLYQIKEPLLDGTYYLMLETEKERSLPLRFRIDTSFDIDADILAEKLGGQNITDAILSGEETLNILENEPDFVGKLTSSNEYNKAQLVWHSVVSGAIAIKEESGRISARPPRPLESGLHDLYISLLNSNGDQGKYIKISFDVHDNYLAYFAENHISKILLFLLFIVFVIVSYYIHFKHTHIHAITLTSNDFITHLSSDYHDRILRKITFKE